MKLLHLPIILILVCTAIFVAPQYASATSGGCSSIGSHLSGLLNKGDSKSLNNSGFWKGDVVQIIVTLQDTKNGSATATITDPRGTYPFTTFPVVHYYVFDQAGNASFTVANLDTGNGSVIKVAASCTGLYALPLFADGRLNMDTAQQAAIYCNAGGVDVWRVINSQGYFSLHVTKATIDKVPEHPTQNTLIAEDKKYLVRLYRLTSGELQVNATSYVGKEDYVFTWSGCAS